MSKKSIHLFSLVLVLSVSGTPLARGQLSIATAHSPTPANGSIFDSTWASLSWQAATGATQHDVYFGDSFDDVNNGTGGTYRTRQDSTSYIVGLPGFTLPSGLVRGRTYYWRIDEVEAEFTVVRGSVWSFTVTPRTAYEPFPADGAQFVPTNVQLGWTGGLGATVHSAYFGDDFNTVRNATGAAPQSLTTFKPGLLLPGKTYYWRVDEFDPPSTIVGDIWSFTTAASSGVKAEYFPGMVPLGTPCLELTEPSINHVWGPNEVACGFTDKVSARWMGYFLIPSGIDGYHSLDFDIDDGGKLWLDRALLMDKWGSGASADTMRTMWFRAGTVHTIVLDYFENTGNAHARFRWRPPGEEFFRNVPPSQLRPWQSSAARDEGVTVIVLDHFEPYTNNWPEGQAVFQTWIGGRHWPGYPGPPFIKEPPNGATVGHDIWGTPRTSIMETKLVYSGSQSMAVYYDNTEAPHYSQVDRTWPEPQDWTAHGVHILRIRAHGALGNQPAQFYVAVEDRGGNVTVVPHPDSGFLLREGWVRLDFPLSDFAGHVNLKEVKRLCIGTRSVFDDGPIYLAASTPAANGAVSAINVFYVDDAELASKDGVGASRADLTVGVGDTTVDPAMIIKGADVAIQEIGGTDFDSKPTNEFGLSVLSLKANVSYGITVTARDYRTAFNEISIDRESRAQVILAPVRWSTDNFGGFPGGSVESETKEDKWTITARNNLLNNIGIWEDSDNFHYIYQEFAGNGYIEAEIADIDNSAALIATWFEAGLMIRDELEADSKHAMTIIADGIKTGGAFQWRQTKGGMTDANHDPSLAVSWFRVKRQDDKFTGYVWLQNGTSWTKLGETTITMSDPIYIGIGVTVASNLPTPSETWTCVMDNFNIVQLP